MYKRFILKHRAIAKTITWRITADLLTLLVIYLLTGRFVTGVFVVGIQIFTKTFWFWAHERVWGLGDRPPKGSQRRSVIKTVTWRVLATIDTLIIVLFITKEPLWASSAAVIDTFLKTLAYYIHERVWEYVLSEHITLDLHIHSDRSDGELQPSELLALAHEKKCEYLSICDHDNIDHLDQIKDIPRGMVYIPGVEISTTFPGELHILGYGFDPADKAFRETLEGLRQVRRARNEAMLKNMREQGFDISMEELERESGNRTAGRPHIAGLMEKKGYSASAQEAFDTFLAKGKPLYLEKTRIEPKEAIEGILRAGGIPVLAHPAQIGADQPEELIKELVSYGLKGIEAYYSTHSKEQTLHYLALAKKYDLLVTAGSDFHGKNREHIPLGMHVRRADLLPFLYALRSQGPKRD
ncbi:MAG: DUF2061 domain-containing protein [FCB group bacterium]|nr:DUF2061 domain-containing protein [FCB group bacterium]